MILKVRVIEARSLPAMDLNGLSDPYVRLQLGCNRLKTKVVKKNLNPVWDEEFTFQVADLTAELTISVVDEDKYFNDYFIGQMKMPLWKILDADNLSLGKVWYPLQPKSKKLKNKECGEICLSLSLSQKKSLPDEIAPTSQSFSDDLSQTSSDKSSEPSREYSSFSKGDVGTSQPPNLEHVESDQEEKANGPSFIDRFFQLFSTRKVAEIDQQSDENLDSSKTLQEEPFKRDSSNTLSDDASSTIPFDELLKSLESKDQGSELPATLSGGVILDQFYITTPRELNSVLFSPESNYYQSLADIQGTTALQCEPWAEEDGGAKIKRVITYTKAASKLIKAVKATEEQTYLKADGKSYAVLSSVSTPDVPFGNSFRTEILCSIIPGPDLSSGEQSSHLVVSWQTNYLQSTMMKSMIENGAKQGLKDSYAQFSDLLLQKFKKADPKSSGSSKDEILSSLQREQESDWKLAYRLFGNFTVISTFFVFIYVLVHIWLSNPSAVQGLEFVGLDLPDSIGEVVVCGVLVLQAKHVIEITANFFHARNQRGSDHGVKARGDGWVVTVALVEGHNLPAVSAAGFSDPYVVFTCNGRTKTSSIKFQTLEPQWKEIFEFDATDDPPSTMNVDVYDFDGPYDEAISLGHAGVDFLKHDLSDLEDIWISLEGKLAQACQSRLHLRIFLNNTRGSEVVTEYLSKMEKEVGKKINLRSPQTNSTFQKLFGLPKEEFLINDFTCHLKRKMPVQGRLFLSPRIIGFYSNLFGYKTKFFFLREDIEDIQVVPPTLASMGSPSVVIILHRGRGMDSKHWAKSIDEDGRLKFHFQSFVSFNAAQRTIMALWKAKSLTPEQEVQLVEEDSEDRSHSEDSGSFLGIEDAQMSEIFSSVLHLDIKSLMEIFGGGPLERKIMEKVGCIDYSISPWEEVKRDISQRQIHYKFSKNVSLYGGEVTSTQQKSPLPDRNGWIVEEVMALQGVLLGDYFNLHLRYLLEDGSSTSKACDVRVLLGIAWLKSTKHEKKIMKNVISGSSIRLEEMFRMIEESMTGK